MTNYLIEGNVDFYKELSKLMNEETDEQQNSCLITNEPLTENSVTLECNHSFNYLPLFHDIQNQKKKYNHMERQSLKIKQIRCPYCRNVQSTLLPYYEMIGVTKVHGVNYYDEKYDLIDEYKNSRYSSHEYVKGSCAYSVLSTQEGSVTEVACSNKYVKKLSFDNKCYCVVHRLAVLKSYLAEKKQKEKEEAKKAKDLAKQKAKEEKLSQKKLQKEQKKQQDTQTCKEILKTGKNKGKTCCQKVYDNSTLCLRHYNLKTEKNKSPENVVIIKNENSL